MGFNRLHQENGCLMKRKLTAKYLSALLLVGVLLIASYLGFNLYFKTMESDGYFINISGRQRMLSQRIAFLSSELGRNSHPTKISEIQNDLIPVIETMEQTHQKLVGQAEFIPELREIYFGKQYDL